MNAIELRIQADCSQLDSIAVFLIGRPYSRIEFVNRDTAIQSTLNPFLKLFHRYFTARLYWLQLQKIQWAHADECRNFL